MRVKMRPRKSSMPRKFGNFSKVPGTWKQKKVLRFPVITKVIQQSCLSGSKKQLIPRRRRRRRRKEKEEREEQEEQEKEKEKEKEKEEQEQEEDKEEEEEQDKEEEEQDKEEKDKDEEEEQQALLEQEFHSG